jgi:hypothetical protein
MSAQKWPCSSRGFFYRSREPAPAASSGDIMSNVNPPVTTTEAELNRYFQMIDRRVPISVSQFIRWLRMPSSFAVRLVIAILLILGGIFSFLPVLGIWMLPLGLLLIAQDVPLLQKPLVTAFAWVERKCEWLRVKWRDR